MANTKALDNVQAERPPSIERTMDGAEVEYLSNQMVSLVIPVYNEASHLEEFLTLIDRLELPIAKELVIIDDCSTDGSAEIIRNFPFKSAVIFIHQPTNQGKGAAIRVGIQKASGNFIGIQDADFEYDPQDIAALLKPLVEGKAEVVFGSRFKKSNYQVHRTFHYFVNRVLTLLSNVLSGLYLTDMETCYKFFRADVIKNIRLEADRFGFEPEVTAKIAHLKLRIMELPISYFPRNYIEGKKITWMDGVAALRHIFYFNLMSRKSRSYYETLPEEYIPKNLNWL
ncbi:MAG TPA: glycosyltransferase family 2 protein [Pyrinomonadaceae bacterium]|jgi:glycosyltransferase involved in cell wall biosynthesis